jgi:hypothetical protein
VFFFPKFPRFGIFSDASLTGWGLTLITLKKGFVDLAE